MKDAVATWLPRAGRLGPAFADPSTEPPSSTATTVRPGGDSTHSSRASDEPRPSGYA